MATVIACDPTSIFRAYPLLSTHNKTHICFLHSPPPPSSSVRSLRSRIHCSNATASASIVSANVNFSTKPTSSFRHITKLDDALQLFDEMLQKHPLPPVLDFYRLIGAVLKMKHYSTALSLSNRIDSLGLVTGYYTLSIRINCYCHLKQVRHGFAVLATVFKLGHVPDVSVYNNLINGLVLEDRVLEAVEFFEKLIREKVCEPNEFTFGAIVKGLCKEGLTSKALALVEFMEEESSCGPGLVVYNTIIAALCKERLEDADGLVPIDGYSVQGKLDQARELLHRMADRDLAPDIFSYTCLINGYCKNKKMDEAMNLFQELQIKGLKPNVVTYTTLIQGFFQVGRSSSAMELFNEMQANGHTPSLHTYGILLAGMCKDMKTDEATNLFQEMQNQGLKPNLVIYSTLIQGLFAAGRCLVAKELFDEMPANGIRPSVHTYNIVLAGMCKNSQLTDALSLFRSMENSEAAKDFTPDTGRDRFEELLSEGLEPDSVMKEQKCLPNSVTYNIIFQALVKVKESLEALKLLEQMVSKGFLPDSTTFSYMLNLFPDEGQHSALLADVQKHMTCKDEKFR